MDSHVDMGARADSHDRPEDDSSPHNGVLAHFLDRLTTCLMESDGYLDERDLGPRSRHQWQPTHEQASALDAFFSRFEKWLSAWMPSIDWLATTFTNARSSGQTAPTPTFAPQQAVALSDIKQHMANRVSKRPELAEHLGVFLSEGNGKLDEWLCDYIVLLASIFDSLEAEVRTLPDDWLVLRLRAWLLLRDPDTSNAHMQHNPTDGFEEYFIARLAGKINEILAELLSQVPCSNSEHHSTKPRGGLPGGTINPILTQGFGEQLCEHRIYDHLWHPRPMPGPNIPQYPGIQRFYEDFPPNDIEDDAIPPKTDILVERTLNIKSLTLCDRHIAMMDARALDSPSVLSREYPRAPPPTPWLHPTIVDALVIDQQSLESDHDSDDDPANSREGADLSEPWLHPAILDTLVAHEQLLKPKSLQNGQAASDHETADGKESESPSSYGPATLARDFPLNDSESQSQPAVIPKNDDNVVCPCCRASVTMKHMRPGGLCQSCTQALLAGEIDDQDAHFRAVMTLLQAQTDHSRDYTLYYAFTPYGGSTSYYHGSNNASNYDHYGGSNNYYRDTNGYDEGYDSSDSDSGYYSDGDDDSDEDEEEDEDEDEDEEEYQERYDQGYGEGYQDGKAEGLRVGRNRQNGDGDGGDDDDDDDSDYGCEEQCDLEWQGDAFEDGYEDGYDQGYEDGIDQAYQQRRRNRRR